MRAAIIALASASLLSACAADRLTLTANEDGEATGAVAIIPDKNPGDEVLVDAANSEAKLSNRPRPRAIKQLKPAYVELFKSLPPKAKPFTIKFPSGATTIPPEYAPIIDSIRKELIDRGEGVELEVVGHTDTVGGPKINEEISLDRAKAVVRALIAEGFKLDEDAAVGRGELELAVPTPDETDKEENRRVVVVVR